MDPVRLVFDWPDGLVLHVREERFVAATDHERQRRYRSENVFTLAWHRAVREVRVRDHTRRVLESTPPPPGVFDHSQISRYVEECAPSFTVTPEGRYAALLPGVGDAVRDGVGMPESLPRVNPQIAGLVARFTTDGMIGTTAQTLWNSIVGAWAGQALPEGASMCGVTPLPIAGMGVVDHDVDLALVERREDGRVRVRCAVVSNAASLARTVEAIAAPGLGGLRVLGAETSTITHTETWPDGLVPVEVAQERAILTRATHPSAGERSTTLYDRRTWRYEVDGTDDA